MQNQNKYLTAEERAAAAKKLLSLKIGLKACRKCGVTGKTLAPSGFCSRCEDTQAQAELEAELNSIYWELGGGGDFA